MDIAKRRALARLFCIYASQFGFRSCWGGTQPAKHMLGKVNNCWIKLVLPDKAD
jgi:hypothetical protein